MRSRHMSRDRHRWVEMGVPVKITLRGKPVFLCCTGCIGKAKPTRTEH